MAQQNGAAFLLKKNSVTVAGGRTLSLTVNGTPINTTTKGDGGVQEYLAGVLTGISLELSFEGIEEDGVLRGLALGAASGKFLTDVTVEFPDGDTLSGDLILTNYAETGSYEDAQTFTATIISDGAWTYTPAV